MSGNRRHIVRNASNLETGESGDAANLDAHESSGDGIVSALGGDIALDAGVIGVDSATVDGLGGLGGTPAAGAACIKAATHASDGHVVAVNPAGKSAVAIATSDAASDAGPAVAGFPAGGAAAVDDEDNFHTIGVGLVCISCTFFTLTTFIRFGRRTGARLGTTTGGGCRMSSGLVVLPAASTEFTTAVVTGCTAVSLVLERGLG